MQLEVNYKKKAENFWNVMTEHYATEYLVGQRRKKK